MLKNIKEPKPMNEMLPCEIGLYRNEIVMRTAWSDNDRFEVMIISKPGINKCWDELCNVTVHPLPEGTSIVLYE